MVSAARTRDEFGNVPVQELATNPAVLAPALAPVDSVSGRPFFSSGEAARLLYALDASGTGTVSLPLFAHFVTDISDITAKV